MSESNRCVIVGTGAMATLFAARLSSVKIDVTLLGSWDKALEVFKQRGAQIEGEPAYPVNAISDPNNCSPFYQSIVLVKSSYTDKAAQQLRYCLDKKGYTLTLQNGLGNIEKLISVLGKERVITGVTTIGAKLLSPGVVIATGNNYIWMEKHPNIGGLAELFQMSNFRVHLVDDMQPYLWRKLIVNCAINPITAILRVKNEMLIKDPLVWNIVKQIVIEATRVANAVNAKTYLPKPISLVRQVAKETGDNYSSMLQDVLRGVPTEIDSINGEIIKQAKIHEMNVPINKLVYSLVCENRYLSAADLSDLSKSVGTVHAGK